MTRRAGGSLVPLELRTMDKYNLFKLANKMNVHTNIYTDYL